MMRHEISKFVGETQGVERSLSEPHFDDEATLLSARRVVPFHKLTAQKNSKRRLLFGTALAAALMMGIVGGVIFARLEKMPASRAETTETAAQPLPQNDYKSSSQQEDGESSVPDEFSVPDESTTLAVNKSAQKTIDKPRNRSTISKNPAALNPSPTQQAQTEPDDSDYYWNERAIRRAERRAARHARREAAREAQRADDLFRIQEIFEGSSRP